MKEFNYSEAFKRNIGLLTQEEQNKLKQFTIAIPGCGGVGGNHLISLVREGFEKFKIADMDVYELKNLNRQYGAELKTLNKEKVKVMKKKALEINPNCQIELFEEGINSENLDQFLENVDIAIDGLDFFEIDIRREFFNESLKKDIPVITAGPIGFSVAGLIFDPKKRYNFDNYFDINNKTPQLDKLIHFAAGLAPSITQRKYMKNTSLKHKHGPSSIGAINLCSGFVVINTLKILLNWGDVKYVPYYQQLDVRKNIYICKKNYFGNKNPIQKLKIKIGLKLIGDN